MMHFLRRCQNGSKKLFFIPFFPLRTKPTMIPNIYSVSFSQIRFVSLFRPFFDMKSMSSNFRVDLTRSISASETEAEQSQSTADEEVVSIRMRPIDDDRISRGMEVMWCEWVGRRWCGCREGKKDRNCDQEREREKKNEIESFNFQAAAAIIYEI